MDLFIGVSSQLSEWLLFNANFSAISWREQVNFQWDDDASQLGVWCEQKRGQCWLTFDFYVSSGWIVFMFTTSTSSCI